MGDKVRDLAGSEVMTWNVDQLPLQVAEQNGPLVVKLRGDVVRAYPWHTHPVVRKAVLYILDVARQGAVVGEHAQGTWDEVQHEPRWAGLF